MSPVRFRALPPLTANDLRSLAVLLEKHLGHFWITFNGSPLTGRVTFPAKATRAETMNAATTSKHFDAQDAPELVHLTYLASPDRSRVVSSTEW